MAMSRSEISGLYAITPDITDTGRLCQMVEQTLAGGVGCLQYRNKSADAPLRLVQSSALLPLCQRYQVPLIINDYLELACQIGADGLHVGQDDSTLPAIKDRLAPHKLIGVSCYSQLARAVEAEKAGASYVAFGAFFPSATKPNAVRAAVSLISEAKSVLSVPVVAIGGIDLNNAASLVARGCDAIAVSQALFGAEDIEFAAKCFSRLF
ncbi:thiamine-phosphate pyrophosphorylase [Nitrosomonas halophila]|uniref:Thiamine-phosphate synthase n=2 Tax=Nitrosomonas halophila TaxID=44576 RepID=A0A1H3CMG6_9PROT|nr:thiamine-phosphate pyrophosphorylase [Nitrosomonas halophila]